jgi:hypothetical protein
MTTEERLEKLEKELAGAKTIRAERFEVVDSAGNVRAVLSVGLTPAKLGQLGLELFGQDGKTCRAVLGTKDGSPLLVLCDQNGKTRAGLSVAADGTPRLELLDQNGKVIWSAPRIERGSDVKPDAALDL